jgi:acyl-CoA synthetase (AMP-forming)/AMP-acid ligase II/acyl carrier protein
MQPKPCPANNFVNYLLLHSHIYPRNIAFHILENEGSVERKICWWELELKVKIAASQLTLKKLPGKRAVLIYQDTLEFIISFLACQYAGIIAVPVPYAKGSKQLSRLLAIINDAQATAILCTRYSLHHLQQSLGGVLADGIEMIVTDTTFSPEEIHLNPPVGANEIAFIQYTSGSTGKPKGVVISSCNLIHNQRLIKATFGCDQQSIIFSWLPFHHDMGLIGNILHTVYVGCTCILMPPSRFIQTPKKWLEAISHYKVTHSGAPNFAYDLCVNKITPGELEKLDLSNWKVAYNGSEPVRHETLQKFSNQFKAAGFNPNAFYPCYGLAEATLLVSGKKQHQQPTVIFIDKQSVGNGVVRIIDKEESNAWPIVSAGKLAGETALVIISTHQVQPCGELEAGEICISGKSVSTGYWNKDNSETFYELHGQRFLRTGDLGFLYKGELFVYGRLKEMLIIRGRNVYPYDIEQMVANSDPAIEINGVALFSINDLDEEFVIVVEIKRALIDNLDKERLIHVIDKIVSGSFGVSPFDIVLTTSFGIPRTTSGKLQRTKCRDSYRGNAFSVIASKSGLSKKNGQREKNVFLLTEVLRDSCYENIKAYVIDLIESKIGNLPASLINDSSELTEIGVDSLRAMEIINTINKDLSIQIDATKIYQHNTLGSLISTTENMLWLKTEQFSGNEITI